MANIVISGDTSGSVTLSAPAVSGTTVLTLPTTSGTIVTTTGATALTTSGNLTFTGTGNRILGDFSNSTLANRLMFQNSVTNGATSVGAMPNGTGANCAYNIFAGSDVANTSFGQFRVGTDTGDVRIASGQTGTGTYLPLLMFTGGSERLRIDTSGNVGIGTNSPSRRLEITGSIDANALIQVNSASTSTQAILGVTSGSNTGFVGTLSNNDFVFRTNNTERMRIDSSGDLLVGRTSAPATAARIALTYNPNAGNRGLVIQASVQENGTAVAFLNTSGTTVGTITQDGSATAYNTSSDYRLKENIAPMTGALAKIALLKPVTYKWKLDGTDGQGFIAHELQAVVPGCVTGEKDAVDAEGNPKYQGVDTSFLVATLTAAIQEQQAIITQLQADVAALKGKA